MSCPEQRDAKNLRGEEQDGDDNKFGILRTDILAVIDEIITLVASTVSVEVAAD
jgi:hypothetical protein